MSEEFKAIIELVGNAGTGAVWVAMAYMAWKVLLSVICWGGAIWLAKTAIAGILKVVTLTSRTTAILKHFRGMLGIGGLGVLGDRDLSSIETAIMDLIKKEKAK